MYSSTMSLTKLQLNKLKKNETVRVSNEQLSQTTHRVDGMDYDLIRKINLARKNGRGVQFSLNNQQLQSGGNPILLGLAASILEPIVEKGLSNLIEGKNIITGKGLPSKKKKHLT
jgi:hypothetical protein